MTERMTGDLDAMKTNGPTMGRDALCALAVGAVLATVGLPSAASAKDVLKCDNGSTFPCGIQLKDLGIQKVPSVFKFQARVSQAKLPIGKGTFGEVVVKLLEGDTMICKESFQNVEVRDSVLNLEIGRNMSCELDEKIARGSALAFQVCLGSEDSCLKPIELAAVPYSVKASFAHMAQSAHDADQAAIAHYAFRAAADQDLSLLKKVSTGYFDFHSKDATNGYFMWTPVGDPTAHNMTITGQVSGSSGTVPLNTLTFGSATTIAKGDLFVEGAHTVQGDLSVAGNSALIVSGDATVKQDLDVKQKVTVAGTTTLGGKLTVVSGGLQVSADGLLITGTSTFNNELIVVGGAAFQSSLSVEGDVISRGALVLRPKTAGATTPGFAAIALSADDLGEPLLVIGPRTPGASVFDQVPAVHVDGPLFVNSSLTATSTATFKANAVHEGTVIFRGNVDFRDATAILGLQTGDGGGGVALGNYSFSGEFVSHDGISVLRGTAGNADLKALGGLDVTGVLQATGGLNVLGPEAIFGAPSTFKQAATFYDGINLRLPSNQVAALFTARTNGDVHLDENNTLKNLIVEAPTTFAGGNIQTTFEGKVLSQGSVTAQGALTANGWLRIGDAWRFGAAEGLQAVAGGSPGNYQSVLTVVGGNQLVFNGDNKFGGGVKFGGLLVAKSQLVAEAGLEVKVAGSTRLRVDASEVRILSGAEVSGVFKVDPPGGKGGLSVTGSGVTLTGDAATTHHVQGALQVDGPAQFSGGITGSGVLKVVGTSCETVTGLCPAGKWSVGIVAANATVGIFGSSNVSVQTRCCAMGLAQ